VTKQLTPSSLIAGAVTSQDRVVVIGATGWFGRTALRLLAPVGNPILPIASRTRRINVAGHYFDIEKWDLATIEEFQPTLIIDSAFLTRGLLSDVPLADYIRQNEILSERLLTATRIPSVERVISVSSGAAIFPEEVRHQSVLENPYGVLKRNLERRLVGQAAESGFQIVIPRAWSVSGPEVQYPHSYAFSDLILQARKGNVRVAATHEVWRRYVAADDLLTVALALSRVESHTFSSGGDLVELGELAKIVVAAVNPAAQIEERTLTVEKSDHYHSDNVEWSMLCSRFDFTPREVAEQIALTNQGLATDA
jgi:nucleoside-diphosphate-sugar epimerase